MTNRFLYFTYKEERNFLLYFYLTNYISACVALRVLPSYLSWALLLPSSASLALSIRMAKLFTSNIPFSFSFSFSSLFLWQPLPLPLPLSLVSYVPCPMSYVLCPMSYLKLFIYKHFSLGAPPSPPSSSNFGDNAQSIHIIPLIFYLF